MQPSYGSVLRPVLCCLLHYLFIYVLLEMYLYIYALSRSFGEVESFFIQNKNKMLGLLCFITSILYLFHVFFSSYLIIFSYSLLAGALLAFAIFAVRRTNKITATILISVGTIIFISYEVNASQMILGLGRNINLLTLFLVVPFFGVIISIGGYLTALRQKVQERSRNGAGHPYRLSYILTSTMGIILNLGSIPLVLRIAEESFSSFTVKKMGVVILRAFGFCMFWSPYFVNVGLVMVLFDISWSSIGWVGIIIALVYLATCFIFFSTIRFPQDEEVKTVDPVEEKDSEPDSSQKMISLLKWSVSLLIISFTLDYFLSVKMLTIVSLLGLIYPLIWATVIGRASEYIHNIVNNISHSFERLKNEIVIFISAGYFGVSLSYTGLGDLISYMIFDLSFGSIYVMSVLIIIFSVTLAIIGIHPVIVIIGVGSALSPSLFGVSPEYMAIVLLISWSLATLVSPFSGSVLMTSRLINESPWAISRQNVLFVLVLMFLLPLILYVIMTLHLI
jgi:hypothetical protein